MTTRIAISDLHLGYDESVLTDPSRARQFAQALQDIAGGPIDELILNGDVFEGCVPKDAGQVNPFGFTPAVMQAAQSLFVPLGDAVRKVTWVAGNHDLDMSLRVRGHEDMLFGPTLAGVLQHAYPAYYIDSDDGFVAFHHGHFLDSLVLGLDNEAEYIAVAAACGVSKPVINTGDPLPLSELDAKTNAFVRGVWTYNSKARHLEWDIIRRFQKEGTNCESYPQGGEAQTVTPEVFSGSLKDRFEWFMNLVLLDPESPAPGRQNFLVLGHDHRGGQETFIVNGVAVTGLNTGGWVDAPSCRTPHCHAVVFRDWDVSTWCVSV